ncbi:MAG: hypothetical protein M3R25_12405 [Bacteroidota bacterium]|nr:hypothetical protein [Bacteroidota bacterium]
MKNILFNSSKILLCLILLTSSSCSRQYGCYYSLGALHPEETLAEPSVKESAMHCSISVALENDKEACSIQCGD